MKTKFLNAIYIALGIYSVSAMAVPTLNLTNYLQDSNQFILVTTENWDDSKGYLNRYQRTKFTHKWKKVGEPIPVLIGRKGMGIGAEFTHFNIPGPIKKEGDAKSPMGIFKIGSAFGFDEKNKVSKKMEYIPINQNTVCVDDSASAYYDKVLDSTSVLKPDWNSKEEMRKQVPYYHYGAIVQYNNKQTSGAGSCIFIHLSEPNLPGTSGCIAMNEANLKQLLKWLDKKQQPTIGLFTKPVYAELQNII